MNKRAFMIAGCILSTFINIPTVDGQISAPVSIEWKSERVVPDGAYKLTHDESFLFARLSPAEMIATPTDITMDHKKVIPKGTIFAWDLEHNIACEPIRRRGTDRFYCLQDPEKTGKFSVLSVIGASGTLNRPGYLPTGVKYEYLLGKFSSSGSKAVDPIEIRSFSSVENFGFIDIMIRYEGQYKGENTSYSICTTRNMGKGLLSFKHDQIVELCPPEFIVIEAREFPKSLDAFGYRIKFMKFDQNYTDIEIARIDN